MKALHSSVHGARSMAVKHNDKFPRTLSAVNMKSLFSKIIQWVSWLSAVTLPLSAFAQDIQSLSLSQAIEIAQKDSKSWAEFDARTESAKKEIDIVKANYWPKISVDASIIGWTHESKIDIVDKSELAGNIEQGKGEIAQIVAKDPMLSGLLLSSAESINQISNVVSGMGSSMIGSIPESMILKDRFTVTFGASLMMPLTPLFKVYHGTKLAQLGVDNVDAERSKKALDISYEVTDVYLKLVYAQLMTDVAKEAKETIDKHLELAQKYEDVGMLSHSDVLAAKVEAVKAQQKIVEAENSTKLAALKLAQVLAVGKNAALRASDMPRENINITLESLDYYQELALQNRSEFKQLDIARQAADKRKTIAYLDYIPQLFLIGRYQFEHGIDVLKPQNQAFVGLGMTWTLFDGLKHHHEAQKAQADASQYSAKADEAKELIELDVAQKYLALQTAIERVKLTKDALALADENLRTINAQFAQGESVNTDVLAAQTRRTAAKADDVKARIDILTSVAQLKLSSGLSPDLDDNAFE